MRTGIRINAVRRKKFEKSARSDMAFPFRGLMWAMFWNLVFPLAINVMSGWPGLDQREALVNGIPT